MVATVQANREWLTCAQTAKLVRQALAQAFPRARFSVRSSNYAGGASISVRWTDGPRTKEVEPVAKQYEGADFDGSIDLKTHTSHYLRPDGSVYVYHAQGTEGSKGTIPAVDNRGLAPLMPEGVRVVHFGADSVSCRRDITNEDVQTHEASAWLMAHCKIDTAPGPIAYAMFGNRYVSEIARSMVYDRIPGEDWAATFDRFCNPYR